jgi:hypothetical protein
MDVQTAAKAVMDFAEPSPPSTLYDFERRLWTALLALGRAMVGLYLAHRAAQFATRRYEQEGQPFVVVGTHASEIATRFGKVKFVRPRARVHGKDRGAPDLPVDRALGLCGHTSLGVVTMVAQLCARMAFGPVREVFAASHEWTPGQELVLRIVDTTGAQARPFLEQAPVPDADDEGEILVIQVDGGGAPMLSPQEMDRRRRPHKQRANRRIKRRLKRLLDNLDEPVVRPRRGKGKKSKNAKVAVIGVIYTLRVTPDGVEGPLNKRVIATFESHAALFKWLHPEAVRRGYGQKTTLFLSDGSEAILSQQQRYFPAAKACLDWWHVLEKLWESSTCVPHKNAHARHAWVLGLARKLRRGRAAEVLAELQRALDATAVTGPGNKHRRKTLQRVLDYLTKHEQRMPYAEFRKNGWDIGSGVVEGAVRQLVRVRLDGPGMRWGRQRAEYVLHLRCILLNGQWDSFVAYLAKQDTLPMAAHPPPAITHVAVKKAA